MAVGDWVPMVSYGVPLRLDFVAGGGQLRLDELIVATGDDLGLSAETGIVETQAEVLVKRVVGGVVFRAAFGRELTIMVKERIRVGLLSDEGNPTFFAYNSLMDASQANEPFLWERLSVVDFPAADVANTWPQADVGHPGWSTIDVRVSRKLSRAEALFYSVDVTPFAGDFVVEDIMFVIPCLRAWARALG